MKSIAVNSLNSYAVTVGNLDISLPATLSALPYVQKIMLVYDTTTHALFSKRLMSLLSPYFDVCEYVLPDSEQAKSVATYTDICSTLIAREYCRHDVLIAIGGGKVSDLTGFVASTYMRGVRYINIPTTLLAMIDASIGGKTALNVDGYKNVIGTFYQPTAVLCDVTLLASLDLLDRYNKSSLGELVKYCILVGEPLFNITETYAAAEVKSRADLEQIISLCLEYKANLVCQDEKDEGARHLLNLGHTLAHIIESASGFSVTHGDAVAQGVMHMCNASAKQGILDEASIKRIYDLYSALDLRCVYVDLTADLMCKSDLFSLMLADKKRTSHTLSLSLVKSIGDCYIQNMSLDQATAYLGLTAK